MKQSSIGAFFKKAGASADDANIAETVAMKQTSIGAFFKKSGASAECANMTGTGMPKSSSKRKADAKLTKGSASKRSTKQPDKVVAAETCSQPPQNTVEEVSDQPARSISHSNSAKVQSVVSENKAPAKRLRKIEDSEDETGSDHAIPIGCSGDHVVADSGSSAKRETKTEVETESGDSEEAPTDDERLVDDQDEMHSDDELEELATADIKAQTRGLPGKDEFVKYNPVRDCEWSAGPDLPYIHMSRLFHDVEGESRRIPNINRITNFFRSVIVKNPEAMLSVVYLCINKLGPDYEGIEIGVGDGLIIKVLAQSTGRNVKKLSEELRIVGDLGEIAEKSRSSQTTIFPPPPLTVCKVFKQFRKIALESKADKKIGLIKSLLVASRESEARYVVRSFQGNLRIGCSVRTILPSLARAIVLTPPLSEDERNRLDKLPDSRLDRSLVLKEFQLLQEIEAATAALKKAWVECPNFSRIIPTLLHYPIAEINKHCFLTPGIPIKCMLAAPAKSVTQVLENFDNRAIVLEYKYDGERVQIHVLDDGEVHVFSRNAETTTAKYPDIVSIISKTFKAGQVQSCIIDAEAVAFDRITHCIRPFQVLSTRKRKDVQTEDISVDICIFAFDLIFLNGESLLSVPLKERRRLLHSSFNEIEDRFRFTISKETSDEMEITQFLDESIAQNCEGLMVKCLNDGQLALYEPDKRSHAWRKLKKDYMQGLADSFDLIPIGAYYGKGKRTGTFGGYLLAVYDCDTEEVQSVCKIGTGFSDEMLQTLTNWANEHIIETPRNYYRFDDKDLPDEWLDGSQVWEVRAADLSISPVHKAAIGLVSEDKGIALRFPRFIQVRPDKKPEDATSSSQVAECYQNQHNKQ